MTQKINQFIENKIKQKAQWVHKHYPELALPDLIQEGHELILKLKGIKGEHISKFYLLKAISFHFSNLMRNTFARRGIRMCDVEHISRQEDILSQERLEEIENNIDRERFYKSIKDNNLAETLLYLLKGYKPEEIAQHKNMSIRTVYRHISTLIKLRERWEK